MKAPCGAFAPLLTPRGKIRPRWNCAGAAAFNRRMPDNQPHPQPAVLVLVRDLLFASRISSAAQALGVPIRIVRDPNQLPGQTGSLVIVDLNQPGALDAAAAWKAASGGRVIGFVSHVDAPTIARAREMGLDQVLARSAFAGNLPGLLAGAAPKGVSS